MTENDRQVFGDRVTELAVAKNGKTLPDAQVRGLFDLLKDLPTPQVMAALTFSAQHHRYFPDAASIRKATQESAVEDQATPMPIPWDVYERIRQGEIYCYVCSDTGWDSHERESTVVPGELRWYARPCACRQTNFMYAARRQRERHASQQRQSGSAND